MKLHLPRHDVIVDLRVFAPVENKGVWRKVADLVADLPTTVAVHQCKDHRVVRSVERKIHPTSKHGSWYRMHVNS